MSDLYTIGYSVLNVDDFIAYLHKYKITALCDVRSVPYSQYKSEFNREPFKKILAEHSIAYVFLGDLCGARIEDPECYINGRASFPDIEKSEMYQAGLKRIEQGLAGYNLVLMCAEKDPIACHRTILICRSLKKRGIKIKHILSDGSIEEHEESENRLMMMYKLDQPSLLHTETERLNEAYQKQGEKIAYHEESGEQDSVHSEVKTSR